MATKYRESNMAKWVGVRPAHNGEQVRVQADVVNSVVTLYTVPANKILLLNQVNWAYGTIGAAVVLMYFLHFAAGGALKNVYVYSNQNMSTLPPGFLTFPIPEECAAGDYWTIHTSVAGYYFRAAIHGFLIDA